MSGRSAGAGSRPPALLLHSAGRPGETPLPSLVSLLAACVHRPGLVMTCSGRVQPGPARPAAPAVWISLFCSQRRVRAFCCPPGALWTCGSSGGPSGLHGGGLGLLPGGAAPAPPVPAPAHPGRLLGWPGFALRAAYRRFAALPVVWGRPEALRGRRARTGGAQGVFLPGALPRRCPRGPILAPSRDGAVSSPEARTGVLPASRWFRTSGSPAGPPGLHRGGRECVPPGLSPADSAAPVLPGRLLGPAWDIPVLLSDTAHKLATLIYTMLRYGQECVDAGAEYHESQYQQRALRAAKRRAAQLGYQLAPMSDGQPRRATLTPAVPVFRQAQLRNSGPLLRFPMTWRRASCCPLRPGFTPGLAFCPPTGAGGLLRSPPVPGLRDRSSRWRW